MSSICPLCFKLVPIRLVRIDPITHRFVYRPYAHDGDGRVCFGQELK